MPVSLERSLKVTVPSLAVLPDPEARAPEGRVIVKETLAPERTLLFWSKTVTFV